MIKRVSAGHYRLEIHNIEAVILKLGVSWTYSIRVGSECVEIKEGFHYLDSAKWALTQSVERICKPDSLTA